MPQNVLSLWDDPEDGGALSLWDADQGSSGQDGATEWPEWMAGVMESDPAPTAEESVRGMLYERPQQDPSLVDLGAPFARGAIQATGGLAALPSLGAELLERIGVMEDTPLAERGGARASKAISDFAEAAFPTRKSLQGTFWGDVLPSAAGSSIPMVAGGAGLAGMAARAAGSVTAAGGFAAGALSGAATMAGPGMLDTYWSQIDKGATEEEAEKAALLGAAASAGAGALEGFPGAQVARLWRAAGLPVSSVLGNMMRLGGAEALQEGVQTGIETAVVDGDTEFVFQDGRDVWDWLQDPEVHKRVGTGAAAGAVLGLAFGAGAMALRTAAEADPEMLVAQSDPKSPTGSPDGTEVDVGSAAPREPEPGDLDDLYAIASDASLVRSEQDWMHAVTTVGAVVRHDRDGWLGRVSRAATDPVNGEGAAGTVLVDLAGGGTEEVSAFALSPAMQPDRSVPLPPDDESPLWEPGQEPEWLPSAAPAEAAEATAIVGGGDVGGLLKVDRKIWPSGSTEGPQTLVDHIVSMGGIDVRGLESTNEVAEAVERLSPKESMPGFAGLFRGPKSTAKVQGANPETVHEALAEMGFSFESGYDVIDAIEAELGGSPTYPMGVEPPGSTPPEGPGFDEDAPFDIPRANQFRVTPESRLRFVQRVFQDKFSRPRTVIPEVVEQGAEVGEGFDPVQAEKLMYGRQQARAERAESGLVDPIVKVLGDAEITLEEADAYLRAWSAPERNEVIHGRDESRDPETKPGSGIPTSVAQATTAELEAGPKGASYRKLAKLYQSLTEENVAIREQAGLLSSEEADAWRETYKKYAPFRSAGEGPTVRSGKRGVRGPESKRAEGRASLSDSPLNFARVQLHEAIARAEQNRVFQEMAEFVRRNPDTSLWGVRELKSERPLLDEEGELYFEEAELDPALKVDPDKAVAFKKDGVRHVIEFSDPLMARAFSNTGAATLGPVTRFLGQVMRALSAMQTSFDPEFVTRNLSRDVQTAGIHLGGEQSGAVAREAIRDIPKAWRGILEETMPSASRLVPGKRTGTDWAQQYRDFRDAGGETGWHYAPTFEDSLGKLERLIADENPGPGRWTILQAQKVLDVVQDVNSLVENGTRLAAFKALRGRVGDRAAAAAARELTVDFNRAGEIGNVLNVWYMFYKAGANGTARVMGALQNRRVRRIAGSLVAFGAARAVVNRMAGGVDEEDGEYLWDKIPEHEKERNMIVMLPPGSVPDKMFKGALSYVLGRVPGEDGGNYLKLPMPWGYNVFDYFGQRVVDVVPREMGGPGKSPGKVAKDIALSLVDAFNPMGTAPSGLQLASPTLLDPYVQLATNENWNGAPMYPERYGPWDKRPDSQLAWKSTPQKYKDAAEWLNEVSGGDKFESGRLDISPEALEHWVGFLTGGVGRTTKRVMDLETGLASGEEREVRQIPFARVFAGETADYVVVGTYYDNREQIEAIRYRAKGWAKEGQAERARDVERANSNVLKLWGATESIQAEFKAGKIDEAERIRKMKTWNKRFRHARALDRK